MLDFLFPAAMAQDAGGSAAATDASMWPSLLMFAGLFLIMYFMLIRPQRKRQKEHQELVNGLNKGDEIVLSSGLLGRISALSDDYLTLDTGSVTLQFQRVAVHAVLPKGTLKGIGQG